MSEGKRTLPKRFREAIRPIFTPFWGVVTAIVLVVASMISAGALLAQPDCDWLFWTTAALWVAWALLPPFFFLMEWTAFDEEKDGPGALARMKYNHELASKFWLGGVGILSAILLYAQDRREQSQPGITITVRMAPPG